MLRKFFVITIIIALFAVGFLITRDNGDDKSNGVASIGIRAGKIAPNFTLTTIDGEKIESKSLRGKIVIITSSAAWCPTCVMEAQQFAPVYQRYKEKGVVFITVDIDPRDNKDFIQQFKIANSTPWYYTDARGGAEIIEKYNLDRFEITYIIDKEGMIAFKDRTITRSGKLSKEIEKLL